MHAAERNNLLASLSHADEELRRLAVEGVTQLPAAEAIPLLIERLADGSWRVRKAAVERLAALPERDGAVSALLGAIADGENSGRRNAAVEALTGCGRSAVPQLLAALEAADVDVDVRKQVVDVLGAIGDARASEAIARVLDDADANVRAAAADALAALGASSAAEALCRASANDSETLVRLAALRALVRLDAAVPIATIEAALADPMLAAAAYAALGQSGEPEALAWILKGLLARKQSTRGAAACAAVALVARAEIADAARLAAALRGFAETHSEIVGDACERLPSAAPAEQLAAIQFVGLLEAQGAVLPLARCASDPAIAAAAQDALASFGAGLPAALALAWPELCAAERAFACPALARAGAGEPAERMLRTALMDASSEVRTAAARGLAECASAVVFGELFARIARADQRDSLESAEEEAQALVSAVVAIAERGDSEAIDAAISLIDTRLGSGGERTRYAAAQLLARLARPADGMRIRALLADASAGVRRQAVEAILRLGHGGDELLRVALADESPMVRAAAAAATAQLDPPGADGDLATLAEDRDPRVRSAVMSALALRAVHPGARALALALLADGVRSDGLAALAALASLQRIGGADAAAIAALGLHSAEPEIVERAVGCVGAHGDSEERAQLLPMLAHAAWPVRARAATELAARRLASAVPHLHERLALERDEFVREALLTALARLEA